MRVLSGVMTAPNGTPLAGHILRLTARASSLAGVPVGVSSDIALGIDGSYRQAVVAGNYSVSLVSPQNQITPLGYAVVTAGADVDVFALLATPTLTPDPVQALLDSRLAPYDTQIAALQSTRRADLVAADLLPDCVVSGLLGAVPAPTSLTMATPGGVAYIGGLRTVKPLTDSDLTYTYPANATTYDYLGSDGAISHGTTASAPAGTMTIQAVTTSATAITAVKDLRPIPASQLGAGAFLDVSFDASTQGTQSIGQSFTTISLPGINSDPGHNFDASAYVYVVPVTGLYQVITTIRVSDSQPASVSYGQGAHISNVDGPWFLWGITNGKREGLMNTRFIHWVAGDRVRLYAYIDSATPLTVRFASMTINLIALDYQR